MHRMRTVRTASALALCMPQGVTLEGLAYLTPTHPNPNQGVTLEGWAYLMYAVQDGYNYYASALFFFIVVVCGSYFVINLFIAVIYDAFMQHMAGTEQVRCGVRCGVRCVAWCVACCIARCIAARACST